MHYYKLQHLLIIRLYGLLSCKVSRTKFGLGLAIIITGVGQGDGQNVPATKLERLIGLIDEARGVLGTTNMITEGISEMWWGLMLHVGLMFPTTSFGTKTKNTEPSHNRVGGLSPLR